MGNKLKSYNLGKIPANCCNSTMRQLCSANLPHPCLTFHSFQILVDYHNPLPFLHVFSKYLYKHLLLCYHLQGKPTVQSTPVLRTEMDVPELIGESMLSSKTVAAAEVAAQPNFVKARSRWGACKHQCIQHWQLNCHQDLGLLRWI